MEEWLACPRCGRDVQRRGDALLCPSGHRFEVGRRGYSALLVGRSGLVRSEPAGSLDAVDADWMSGRLRSVADSVVAMMPSPSATPLRLLDCGRDLGHLVAAVRGSRPSVQALVVGSSPAALVRAIARSAAHGVLIDPARPWPVRDGVAEVVVCGFGEYRPAEIHRALAPGGIAVLAAPEAHADAIEDDIHPWFERDQLRAVDGPEGVPAVVLRLRRRRRPLAE